MEKIIDQLVSQGYEVSGSNSIIRVKIGGLAGKATIRKNHYSNTFVVSSHTWIQLLSLTLVFSSIMSSLYSQWSQPELSKSIWFGLSVGIPVIIIGYVSAIISEIQLQPIRQVVRMANSQLSSPIA
ncbi:hypothetical protein [Vibrio vulnificus]|uniref:hypothetical protein n=1 Tax=Vibrio vulnificus TaxID=672 RepID=UPI0028CC9F64|nr:hypothetical protein [Vibrio vulnificus]